MSLVLPLKTQNFIISSAARPPHALLLTGPVGSGLMTLAQLIASEWGSVLEIIRPESKTTGSVAGISVETIRMLYDRTRSKTAKAQIVIIDDADTMNITAQNAVLKLLEEPVINVHFILTSHRPDRLLATVRSRLQTYSVPPLDDTQSLDLIKSLGQIDKTKQRQILFASGGRPAEIARLSSDEKYFEELVGRMMQAREFIQGDSYNKLVIISKFKDSRVAALSFIETLLAVLRITLSSNSNDEAFELVDKLLVASDAIAANGNIRLQLSAVVV